MKVSLPDELDKFVHRAVASGRYHSSADVVCEGLRLLHERENFRTYVEQAIETADADVRVGRVTSPEAARARLRRHHEQAKRARKR